MQTRNGTERAAGERSRLRELHDQVRGLEEEVSRTLRLAHEKVDQLEELMQFSALLNSTLETSFVREKALEATCRILRCEAASLFLVDSSTAELYSDAGLGEGGDLPQRPVRLPIDDRSIAGWVAMTGESLLVNDAERDARHPRSAQVFAGPVRVRTLLCVPLRARGRVVGVLQALNKLPSARPLSPGEGRGAFAGEDLRLLETLSHQVAIAIENSRLYENLNRNFCETVEALVESIEKKDSCTGGHTKRVVHYSMSIAKHMSLTPEQRERIRLGALLHDVGKIGIEDKILKKAAALDPDEWGEMKKHPALGFDIMTRVSGLQDVIGGMRYHHERWDGKGYPLGLKGEEIPLIARIIAVADTYDAIVSTRPYRKGLDPQFAYQEIVRSSGAQFDPQVVGAFQEAFAKERMGKGSGGALSAAAGD